MSRAKVSALNPANPFSRAAVPEVSEGDVQLVTIKRRKQKERRYFMLYFMNAKVTTLELPGTK